MILTWMDSAIQRETIFNDVIASRILIFDKFTFQFFQLIDSQSLEGFPIMIYLK